MAWRRIEETLIDEASGVAHRITIELPHRFDKIERPPVIVCLDGAWTEGSVRDATRLMSMSGEAPEAIVVGVSFEESSLSELLRQRACWYTPTGWVPPPETGVHGVSAQDTGKADQFQTFLRDRVLPYVEAHAPHGERWLVGHSFGALCGLRILFSEPEMFNKYLLASPSIWWDDRSILGLEAEYWDTNDDLAAEVFVSAGALELGAELDANFSMYRNAVELVERLGARGYRSLGLQMATLAGESHNSTIGPAISAGLRGLHFPLSLLAVEDDRVRTVQQAESRPD